MRRVASAALVCCLTACAGASARPSGHEGPNLAWLVGTWRAEDGDTVTTEAWAAAEDGSLRGLGITRTRDGRTVHHELLRIARRGDGWAYIAAPAGQATTAFALVEASDEEAVFANPEHDFPKRIAYRRRGEELTATVSGDAGQREGSWTFAREDGAPRVAPMQLEVCVEDDGGAVVVNVPPCTCGAEVFCRAAGGELDVAVSDGMCDACVAARGTCEGSAGAPTGCRTVEVGVFQTVTQ